MACIEYSINKYSINNYSIGRKPIFQTNTMNAETMNNIRRIAAKLNLRRLFLLLGVLVSVGSAGQCSISVMPMELSLKAPAVGSRIGNEIEVFNPGTSPLIVTASIKDWTATQDGQLRFSAPGTQPRSCAPWIQLNPMNFSVAAGQSVRVRYSITPPQAITQEHWAMIFFQTRAVPVPGGRMGITINTRIGCKVFVAPTQSALPQGKIVDMDVQTASPPQKDATVSGVATTPVVTETSDAPLAASSTRVKVVFENTGSANLRLQGRVEAVGADGKSRAQGTLTPAKSQILSGNKREFWAQLDKPLAPGTYQFKAIVDYGAKELVSGELTAKVAAPASS